MTRVFPQVKVILIQIILMKFPQWSK